jgi:hypothetical protein
VSKGATAGEIAEASNEVMPHWRFKSVELSLVRPNHVELQPTSILGRRLVGGPSGPWQVSWCCPKSVSCSSGPLDPCEARWCVLISRRLCTLDLACSFHSFLAQIHLHTYLDQQLWNSLDKHPILVLAFIIIPFLCRIWRSKLS